MYSLQGQSPARHWPTKRHCAQGYFMFCCVCRCIKRGSYSTVHHIWIYADSKVIQWCFLYSLLLCFFHISLLSVSLIPLLGEGEGPWWHQTNESSVPLRWEDPDHRIQPYEWETDGPVGYSKSDLPHVYVLEQPIILRIALILLNLQCTVYVQCQCSIALREAMYHLFRNT